jgi:hypothetical protein
MEITKERKSIVVVLSYDFGVLLMFAWKSVKTIINMRKWTHTSGL